MAKTTPKLTRAEVQRRYYQKNKARLIAKAKQRYQDQKRAQLSVPPTSQSEPISESSVSPAQEKKPKGHFAKWIQRFTGKND